MTIRKCVAPESLAEDFGFIEITEQVGQDAIQQAHNDIQVPFTEEKQQEQEGQCVHNLDMERLMSHGYLYYKQYTIPIGEQAFQILQTQRDDFKEVFLQYNTDPSTHVQELEACLRPGESYSVQLLAAYLLIEICGPSDDIGMELKYPL